MRHLSNFVAIAGLTLAVACSEDKAGTADAGADVAPDATSDVATDAAVDTASEPDAAVDAAADVNVDVDGVEDVSADAVEDVSVDAVEDVSVDAIEDVSVDAVEDTIDDADAKPGLVLGETARFTSVRWNGSRCTTACEGELTLDGATLAYEVRDVDGGPTHLANGILTTQGAANLDTVLSALADASLAAVYGCPGCTDGQVLTLTFDVDGAPVTIRYDRGAAPAELTALDALAEGAIAALQTCTGDELVVVQGACPADLP